ncbi:MAG: magnesium transporter [Erysipelothrix sp.]|nr:magnesium transporter [Erysipelothrix sp.]
MVSVFDLTQEAFLDLIHQKDTEQLSYLAQEMQAVDFAEFLEDVGIVESVYVFKVIPNDRMSIIFSYLSLDKQKILMQTFSGGQIENLLAHAQFDDIVDFLNEMPNDIVLRVLKHATYEQRHELNILLSYHPDTAGALLTTEYIELLEDDTVKSALAKVRVQGQSAASINTCFVVNNTNRLLGTVRLKEIMVSNEEVLIADLMETDVVSVNTKDDQEEVVQAFVRYDLATIPVVNDQYNLVGIITADDALDVIKEEATEDILRMASVVPVEGSYLNTSVFNMFKSRIPWLLVLMISASFTGHIISKNETLLLILPTLYSFIPMLMDTAGNAGSQASAMVIRGIVVDDLNIKDYFKVLFKEMQSSLLTGFVLFAVNTLRIAIFMPSVAWQMALVVSFTVYATIILANLVGGSLPLLALVFKVDPASMSGPVVTTVVDALALIVYFAVAAMYLGI